MTNRVRKNMRFRQRILEFFVPHRKVGSFQFFFLFFEQERLSAFSLLLIDDWCFNAGDQQFLWLITLEFRKFNLGIHQDVWILKTYVWTLSPVVPVAFNFCIIEVIWRVLHKQLFALLFMLEMLHALAIHIHVIDFAFVSNRHVWFQILIFLIDWTYLLWHSMMV